MRLGLWYMCLPCLVTLAIILGPVHAQSLSSNQINVVSWRLAEGATHSWEYGTRAQVLLELNAPSYSVFSTTLIPPPSEIPSNLTGPLSDVFGIAHAIVANRSISNGNITGPQPLMNDSAAGDPASIGVAVLLANWTGQGKVDGLDYAGAARDQLEFLLMNVSRTSDGAISHRLDQVQLWSDSVYMVPPFLAYYGAVMGNQTLLQEAYNQIKLYREYLRDEQANNIWKHIQLGSYGTDNGHWSAGNAWAAAGMLHVLSTINHSEFGNSMISQQTDLANWVQEIHDGMYLHLDSSGLFHNYADDLSTFTDASSTAMLASTVYRLALLWGVHKHLPAAELCRRALSAPMDSIINISASVASSVSPPTSNSTSSSPPASTMVPGTNMPDMLHFTVDGWLTPVVDPYAFSNQGQTSPEGQAFVLAMQAAWRDWVGVGTKGVGSAKGVNAAVGTLAPSCPRTVAQAVVAGILLFVLEM
ncbi:Six-hairpin glycosidase-like protein [Scleroderma citrinum]